MFTRDVQNKILYFVGKLWSFFFFQYKVSLTVYFQASLTRPWKWIGLLELYLLFTISICYCSWKEGHGPLWGKWVISGSQEMLLCAPSCVSFVASVNPLLCTNMDPMDFCRLCEHVRPAAAHDAHLFVLAAHTVALTNHNLWRVAVLRHLALADPLTHWEGTFKTFLHNGSILASARPLV